MKSTSTVINRLDKERLSPHIAPTFAPSWPILHLQRTLEAAKVAEPRKIPKDVVTMRSRITVRDSLWETSDTYTLVYPDDNASGSIAAANADGDTVLVTSPMGAAIFGSREGDEVRWLSPRGPRRAFVESIVFQPERAGRFDL